MKIAILVALLVVSVLLVPPTSASRKGQKHEKRAVAAWVGTTITYINLGLMWVPNGSALETAIDSIITAAGTTPFSISTLLTNIFSVVTAAINLADSYAKNPLTTDLNNLVTAICTLVVDAVTGKFTSLGTDIDNIVCAAEALAGLTNCNLSALSAAIDKLTTDAINTATQPATIIKDAFAIVTAAINVGATSGKVAPNVVAAVQKLITDICTLVVDCVTLNTAAIAGAITTVITDAAAFGALAR